LIFFLTFKVHRQADGMLYRNFAKPDALHEIFTKTQLLKYIS
jgi:hypothetical protein